MRRHAANSDRLFILLCVAFVITSLLPSRIASYIAQPPHAVVHAMLVPVVVQLRTLSAAIRPATEQALISEDHAWREQFLQQKQYTVRLEQELAAAREQLADFQQIAEVLEDRQAQFQRARVADVITTPSNRSITIDRGTRSGVEPRQAVIKGKHLVGRVVRVTPVTSTVELVTMPNSILRVRVEPPDAPPGFQSTPDWIGVTNDGKRYHYQIGSDINVHEGYLVYLADDRWPRTAQGFLVGQVVRVEDDPQNPYQFRRVTIEPMIQLDQLGEVTVLIPMDAPRRNVNGGGG